MFLKEKRDGNRNFEILKGRLVTGRSQQDSSLYKNFNSPTASLDESTLELIGAAMKRSKWTKVDVRCAYINALLNDEDIMS